MPTFIFTSPAGTKYSVEGPAGATKEQAAAELQRRLDSGEIAQERVGTERGTNTGNAEYTPPKPVKKSTVETVGKYGADILLGLGNSAAKSVSEIVGSAVAPLAGTAVGIGQDIATRFGDNQGDKSPMQVRQDIIDAAAPKTKTGKAVNQALGTIFYPVGKVAEYATDIAKGAGAPDIYAAAAGDVVGAYTGAKYAQGLGKGAKKVVGFAPEIAKAASPVKVYDAAANAVYNAQKNTSKYLKGQSANIPAGRFKNAVVGTQKIVNAVGSDAAAFGTAGGALASGNVPLAAAVLAARQLRKRGAQNFGKSQNTAKSKNTATSELATTIKQDIASPEVNTYSTEAIGTIGSQNIDDLANSIKADITDTEE